MPRQYTLGEVLKIEGLDRVESNNEDWVTAARRQAVRYSAANGSVSAVELRKWADAVGWHPDHPNAWGSVFRGSQWLAVGYRKTEHAEGHARDIKVWKYISTAGG